MALNIQTKIRFSMNNGLCQGFPQSIQRAQKPPTQRYFEIENKKEGSFFIYVKPRPCWGP